MNIRLTGQHVTIASSITKAELEDALIFAPRALKVFEERNELYGISVGDEVILNPKHVKFNGYNADGNLTISFTEPMLNEPERRLEIFKQEHGLALAALSKFEDIIKAQINDAVHAVDAALESVVVE